MTETPLAAGASPSTAPVPRTGDEILMAFAGPAPQRRVTVLFRLLMAIPHYIVLYALGIAAEVVAVIGWFAALFTGRLPTGLAGFLVDWLRWSARVYAYVGLLTDQYPPFALADADYPVRLSAAPGRLNRLAVLFRIILVIPASILLGLLSYGAAAVGIVIWLIVLITGIMPEPLYQALAAVIRYGARFYGYFFLMSGTYPGGLFGDPAVAGGAAATGGPLTAPATEPGQPAAPQPAAPLAGDAQPGDGRLAASGEAPAAAHWPADPQAWRLVLSTTAKRLVGLIIAVGAIVLVAFIITSSILISRSSHTTERVDAISSISAAHTKLLGQLRGLSQQIGACQSQSDALSCVTRLDQQAASDLGAFGDTVKATPVPPSAIPAAAELVIAASQAQSAFRQLGAASSVSQYEQIDSGSVGPKVAQFNSAYQNLGRALGAG